MLPLEKYIPCVMNNFFFNRGPRPSGSQGQVCAGVQSLGGFAKLTLHIQAALLCVLGGWGSRENRSPTSSPETLQQADPSISHSHSLPGSRASGGRLGAGPALTCPLLPRPSPPPHGRLPRALRPGDPGHSRSCTKQRLVSAALEGRRTESVGKALEGEDLDDQQPRGPEGRRSVAQSNR